MRTKLKETREKRGLNQQQLADRLVEKGFGVRRQTVSEWETLDKTIRTCYIEPIRDTLDCYDPDLFDVDKPAPTETIWDIITMLRREFVKKFGLALGFAPNFENITVAFVTSPQVEPDEYLYSCRANINTWQHQIYPPDNTVEIGVSKTLPVLHRLASSVHPFQAESARLATEVSIMYTRILAGKMMIPENEINCKKTLQYALNANTLFKKALETPATSKGYKIQALTRLADSERALDEKCSCVDSLTEAYQEAPTFSHLVRIHDVLKRTPSSWKTDHGVKELYGAVSDSIVKIQDGVVTV